MLIAQLSDFHARPPGVKAYGGLDTNALMREAVAAVARLDPRPDCVIVTGDIADCGLPEEYAAAVEALAALPMPVYVLPGNHDRRETLREVFAPSHRYLDRDAAFLNYVVDDFEVRLIGLDTVSAGRGEGEVCPVREAWLAQRLEEGRGRPTLLCMHHPPFRTGVPTMDELMCDTAPSFAALIRRHPEIERIVCGHYHRPITVRYAGTIGFVAPGTAHQVALNLRGDAPARLIHEPPGFALHAYHPETGIVSHVVPIGDFGAIQDFELPPEYPGQSRS